METFWNITPFAFTKSALLVLNCSVESRFCSINAARLKQLSSESKDISALCFMHSLRFLTWVSQQVWTCTSSRITQAHTHVCTYTKSTHKKEIPVLCLFPAHETCRWPIRVYMGSFHEIYVNIKHQENPIKHICVGNTEPAWSFRNVFSVALVIALGCFVSSVCVFIFKCTPCDIRDWISVS